MRALLLIASLCFSLLFSLTSAQEPSPEQVQRLIEEQLRFFQSPRAQIQTEAEEFVALGSAWIGQGSWIPLRVVLRTGNDAELGLTDAQKEQFANLYKDNELAVEWFRKMRANPTPEFTQAMEAAQAAELPDDRFFDRATEEQKNAFREATVMTVALWLEAMQTDIEATLTPEQMLQVRKLEMQLMPAMGIPYPSMYDPLDLTAEQKEEMNKISSELKAEFDILLRESTAIKIERIVSVAQSLQEKTFTSLEEFGQALTEGHMQYVPSETIRKKSVDLQERGAKLMSLLQNRLMNVLTDEQLDKMQKIMDESPDFVKQMIAEFKAMQEELKKKPTYVPGPDSWRPGMPLPEQFKQERRTVRFPRGE